MFGLVWCVFDYFGGDFVDVDVLVYEVVVVKWWLDELVDVVDDLIIMYFDEFDGVCICG